MQFKREWVIPIGVGIGSFFTGTGVGYAISKNYSRTKRFEVEEGVFKIAPGESDSSDEDDESRRVELRFEYEEAKREFSFIIQQANYVIRAFKEATSQLTEEAKEAHPSNHKLVVVPTLFDEEEPTTISIFKEEDDDWDYDEELKHRIPERPYIIHRDEFFEQDEDFDQSSLTYYKGDDILCDDKDVPIYDKEKVVGELKFGHGSHDPSICYIRNERLKAEYEVIIDHGYYQIEVLGQHVEDIANAHDLKHSIHRVHKFRME